MIENRTVSGPGLTVFDVHPQLLQTDMGKQTKYLLISADSPVSVFCYGSYLNFEYLVGYLAFPLERWSTKYMVGSYTLSNERYVFCTHELEFTMNCVLHGFSRVSLWELIMILFKLCHVE